MIYTLYGMIKSTHLVMEELVLMENDGGESVGSYLNPGNKGFCESLNSEIYVDKTGLIEKTNAVLNTRPG